VQVGSPADEADRRLLRDDPPADALRWLLSTVGATRVVGVDAMPGGSTAAMHKVTVDNGSGTPFPVVLRRYVLSRILDEMPGIALQEWNALELVAPIDVPTPDPLAVDPTGAVTGTPALGMSYLDGRPQWTGGRAWLDQLVDALTMIHEIHIRDDVSLPEMDRYEQHVYEPPRWSTRPELWNRAFEIFHGPIPVDDVVFVHRDFHAGNTLWFRGRLTGVVDWQAACRGPASIDVGHCRLNLLYTAPELADRLRRTWESRTGKTFDPWADIVSIVGTLDAFRDRRRANNALHAMETVIAEAVSDICA
jgi:aminoglycoside phosphotransferase (APT) family kinase protein